MANNSSEESSLLSLPMELLQRITSSLSDETVITLRLVCKTLETATFDQFAKKNFEAYCFCVLSYTHWTQLQAILKSRLAARLRIIVLTASYCPSVYDIPVAPRDDPDSLSLSPEPEDIGYAQEKAAVNSFRLLTADMSAITFSLVHDTLAYLHQKRCVNRSIRLVLNDDCMQTPRLRAGKYAVLNDILQSVVSSRIKLRRLTLTRSCMSKTMATITQFEKQFLACTSSLQALRLRLLSEFDEDEDDDEDEEDEEEEEEEDEHEESEDMPREYKMFYTKVLGNAKRLRELDINMQAYLETGDETTIKQLLFASHLSGLRKLRLSYIRIAHKHLIEVLQRCSATLTCLELDVVELTATDQPLTNILRQILMMPCLSTLSLSNLYTAEDGTLDLQGKSHGKANNFKLKVEGTVNIASRVQALLAGHLIFTG